jgi:hypothetical protein
MPGLEAGLAHRARSWPRHPGKAAFVERPWIRVRGWPDQFFAAVAQHAAGCFVDFEQAQGLGIDQVDAVAGLVDDGPVLLFAFGQRLARARLDRDVAEAPDAARSAPRSRRACSARRPAVLEQQRVVGLGVAAVQALHAGQEGRRGRQLVEHMLQQQVVPPLAASAGGTRQSSKKRLLAESTRPSAATIRMPSSDESSATLRRASALSTLRDRACCCCRAICCSSWLSRNRLTGATTPAVTSPVIR